MSNSIVAFLSHLPSLHEDTLLSHLDARTAHLLTALSIFHGSWTLEAANAICDPNLTYEQLRSEPLSIFVIQEESKPTRFRLTKDAESWGRSQPGAGYNREDHFKYFWEFVQAARDALYRSADSAWLEQLSHYHANIEVAYAQAKGNQILDFALGLWRWHDERHTPAAGENRLWRAIVLADPTSVRASECYRALGILSKRQCDYLAAEQAFEIALKWVSPDNYAEQASIYNQVGLLAYERSQWDSSEAAFRQALSIWEGLGDLLGQATILNNLGSLYIKQARLGQAHEVFSQSGKFFEQLGDYRKANVVFGNFAVVCVEMKRFEEALAAHTDCLTRSRKMRDNILTIHSLNNLGDVYRLLNRYAESHICFAESATMLEEIGYIVMFPRMLVSFGLLQHDAKNYSAALTCFSAAERLGEHYSLSLAQSTIAEVEQARSNCRAQLSASLYTRMHNRGGRMTLDKAMNFFQNCIRAGECEKEK